MANPSPYCGISRVFYVRKLQSLRTTFYAAGSFVYTWNVRQLFIASYERPRDVITNNGFSKRIRFVRNFRKAEINTKSPGYRGSVIVRAILGTYRTGEIRIGAV